MGYNLEDIDVNQLDQAVNETQQWIDNETKRENEQKDLTEKAEAETAKLEAEQADPRNKENWGVGGVVKELQSAFTGGAQDTASSIVTLPERILDLTTGEVVEESKDGGKYDTEWDNWFVDDRNPIETKTWWGGLIRSATHFGSMGVAIVKAAPVIGVGATAVGAGRLVTAAGNLVAGNWARAAAVGAATDLVSKYSQDANGLQVLRDRYGFIDTPLTTNDWDHPVVKTFKNVVEGMGIGELTRGLFRVMGKGMKRLRPVKGGQEVLEDAADLGIGRETQRSKTVNNQTIEKGQLELFESNGDFRGHSHKGLADTWKGSPTSKDNAYDVRT